MDLAKLVQGNPNANGSSESVEAAPTPEPKVETAPVGTESVGVEAAEVAADVEGSPSEPPQKMVPVEAVQDLRRRKREWQEVAEARARDVERLEQMLNQQSKASQEVERHVTPYDHEGGVGGFVDERVANVEARFEEKVLQAKQQISEHLVSQQHPDYKEKLGYYSEWLTRQPAHVQQAALVEMNNHASPAAFLYETSRSLMNKEESVKSGASPEANAKLEAAQKELEEARAKIAQLSADRAITSNAGGKNAHSGGLKTGKKSVKQMLGHGLYGE